jgi:hypothetical protein
MLLPVIIFLINIPFGYWRDKVKKFSLQWFLAVHLPVPFIVTLRLLMGIKLTLPLFLFFVFCYFSGQYIGAIINRKI